MWLVLRMRKSPMLCLCFACASFSFPEATILLVSTKNRDYWPVSIFEHAQNILSTIFSQSDLTDLTMRFVRLTMCQWIGTSGVGSGQTSLFLVLTKRILASGDENACAYAYFTSGNILVLMLMLLLMLISQVGTFLCLCLCYCLCLFHKWEPGLTVSRG